MPFRVGTNRIGRLVVGASSAYDADALAFFTAVEGGGDTLTTTEKSAVNTLVVDLKAASIWSAMTALYPFVGGTSTSCAWNLADTTQYNITWNNSAGIDFSSNGVEGTGAANAYGDTGFGIDTSGWTTNHHLSAYSRTAARYGDGLGWDMGAGNTVNGQPIYGLSIGRDNGSRLYDFGNFSAGRLSLSAGTNDNDGFFMGRTSAADEHKMFKNGSSIGTSTVNPAKTANSRTIWLLSFNGGENSDESDRSYGLFSIGDSIDDSGASDYYTAVQAFQTTLSRQV